MTDTIEVTETQPTRVYAGRRNISLGLCGRFLYHAARWSRRRSAVHQPQDLARTTDESNYRNWRRAELDRQLTGHFDVSSITGRDVLDFGCGTGELCDLLIAHQPQTIVGIDTSPTAIASARESLTNLKDSSGCAPRFVCNDDPNLIPLESNSVDLICCFDVIEHIPDMTAVAHQWRRVLRPEGKVWIWWSPWRGPYGHHLESLIPLPWVHLLFPEKTLFATCAELYDDPDFVPRKWDRDPQTGAKKPNKWRHTDSFTSFLNRLTRRRFERIIRDAGLRITRHQTHGFTGSPLRRATCLLRPLPLIGQCLVSYYIYELSER